MKEGDACPRCGSILSPVSRFQYAQDRLERVEVSEEGEVPATTDIPFECILQIDGLKCRGGHIFAMEAHPVRIMVPCPNPRCKSFLELVTRGKKKFLRCEDHGNRCSMIIKKIPPLKLENRDRLFKEVSRIGWDVENLRIDISSSGWFRSIVQSDDHIEVKVPRTRKRRPNELDISPKNIHMDAKKSLLDGSQGIIMNMIETLDNISRALEDARRYDDVEEVERVMGGLEAIRKGAVNSLKQKGIDVLSPKGQRFDPNFHEAVGVVIDNELPPNTVSKVELDGYMMEGSLLRPAMVIVSKHGREETLDWHS